VKATVVVAVVDTVVVAPVIGFQVEPVFVCLALTLFPGFSSHPRTRSEKLDTENGKTKKTTT